MNDDGTDNTVFQDAMDALRRGDKSRAKERLMALLKTDQNNANYWVWLSATMGSVKERIYCLQTALKLDPENGAAKRGLVLLGALAPDETVQPFSLNRPRAWEEKLLLANEKPKQKGMKAFAKSPLPRLVGVVLIGAALVSAVVFGFLMPRETNVIPTQTNTAGPSPTFTATPTVFGVSAVSTKPFVGPTPLWMILLPEPYTPTAVYVNTPRPAQSVDQYRSAKAAYDRGDWDGYIASLKLIIPLETGSADIYYMIGDGYRFKGDSDNALKAYNDALKIDPNFGPPYLGLALARLMDNPNLNVEYLFDEAIKRDPNFGEVYIERARYFMYHKKYKAALADLDTVSKLMPDSPMVYMAYADAYLASGDKKNALASAEKAYSLDVTDPLIYKMLGTLYIEDGQNERAIEALNVYVIYATENDRAFALLGRAYFQMKDYKAAVENFDKAQALNPNGMRKFYGYKGLANLELNNVDQAVDDLEKALADDGTSFEISLGLARAYFIQEKFGSAFVRAEVLKSLADTDQETALALYWHALSQEKRGEAKGALKDWQELYAMKKDVMTSEMRAEAEQHLKAAITPTNTEKAATETRTPKGGTATPTPKAKGSVTPTVKVSKTPTP